MKGRLGERGHEGLKQNNSCLICTVLSLQIVGANKIIWTKLVDVSVH